MRLLCAHYENFCIQFHVSVRFAAIFSHFLGGTFWVYFRAPCGRLMSALWAHVLKNYVFRAFSGRLLGAYWAPVHLMDALKLWRILLETVRFLGGAALSCTAV